MFTLHKPAMKWFLKVRIALGGIAAMDVGRHKLEIDILITAKFFQDGRALIVEALELGPQSSFVEFGVDGLEGIENRRGGP